MTDPTATPRTALDLLDDIDSIVDDEHPEGDGCPLCVALDELREVLEARSEAQGDVAALREAVDNVLLRYVNRNFGQAEGIRCREDLLAALRATEPEGAETDD